MIQLTRLLKRFSSEFPFRWLWSTLRTTQPIDVSETTTFFLELLFVSGHLLLLDSDLDVSRRVIVLGGLSRRSRSRSWSTLFRTRGIVFETSVIDNSVALGDHGTVLNDPLFWTQSTDEFIVVRNHNNTTSPVSNGDSQTTQGVSIQIIGRFIQDQQMWVVPHGTGNDNLD
ncbi:hypothetical protein WICPIJ_003157 [Wickerhamomyces pijperi]|uniref:Uncharacterized protein n=1 Tax=Wickerhamomyces pijperi TaxID=599730 RepID=A0A9P8Q7U5_WICPI|nr:hypothetical protein WICPIJ_003157 [Wickerhamomyces pijperi]